LDSFIFGLRPFGWLRSITLTRCFFIEISFLRLFIYVSFSETQTGRKTRAGCGEALRQNDQ